MTSIIFKLVTALWPFVKEMIFGKSGATKVVSRNKTAVVSILINLMLSVIVFFFIDLTVSLSTELTELKRSVLETNNTIKFEMRLLQQDLDQRKKDFDRLSAENKVLKEFVGRSDPNRRDELNERLERLYLNR